jgi:YVTN family beta-propeller protein
VYEVVLTGAVTASGGGALTNPGVSDFTTVASQPLHLASVWPPSSLVGVAVTLSGQGFDSNFAANTVLFNGVAATPFDGTSDVLRVMVPPTAVSGTVRVVTGAETSNSRAFAVLERSTSTIDDVVATIGTVSGAKSVALSGDGALCYTLGTDGDVVIPINLENESTYPSIPVGDQPVAIVMNPEGTLAYVANFGSGSVSVIDVDPASLDFNHVVESINVGTNPSTSRFRSTAIASRWPTRARATSASSTPTTPARPTMTWSPPSAARRAARVWPFPATVRCTSEPTTGSWSCKPRAAPRTK